MQVSDLISAKADMITLHLIESKKLTEYMAEELEINNLWGHEKSDHHWRDKRYR